MGLMSDLDSERMNETLSRMIKRAHQMGVPKGIEPFIALSFIALPIIPEVRIRTRGLYDVLDDRYLDYKKILGQQKKIPAHGIFCRHYALSTFPERRHLVQTETL